MKGSVCLMMRNILAWVVVGLVLGSTILFEMGCGSPVTAMLAEGEIPNLSSSMEMEGKPARPRLFQTPDQIKNYLESLGKYYTWHNRNRFGKRGRDPPPIFQERMESSDPKPFDDYEVRLQL